MTPEKVSEFIKKLRKKNNLTQKELADKLGVTYQAVSKWENGKNIPDIETLKEISRIFNVDIDDIVGGNSNNKKTRNLKLIIPIIIMLLVLIVVIIILVINNKKDNFEFKQISTTCTNFKITGSAAYNKKTSSIYISNVEFCGTDDEVYKTLECTLYETYGNTKTKISSCNKDKNKNIKDYLKKVQVVVNDYSSLCNKASNAKLYLEIDATNNDDKTTTYKIPISINDTCN